MRDRRANGASEPDAREEVTFHLEMQVRELVDAGWTAEEARAEAFRRFGDVERVEARLRGMDRRRLNRLRRGRVLRDVIRDGRFALRNLRRRPLFALVAILTLGLGIGANAAVFALVDGGLLRPLPLPGADSLVVVSDVQGETSGLPASLPEFDDWARAATFASAMMAWTASESTLTGQGQARHVAVGVFVGDVGGTTGIRPLMGRTITVDEARAGTKVVMASESFWRARLGGQADAIGSVLRIDDESYTVVGVLPDEIGTLRPANSPELWMPLVRLPFMNRGLHFLTVIARSNGGIAGARARAETMAAGLRESGVTSHGVQLRPLRDVLVGSARSAVLILLGAVAVVLLIVCANVANLVIAQSLDRSREFAIRAAMGAGRRSLAGQIMTESVVLGVLGGVAGVLVAAGAARLVNRVAPSVAALAPSPFAGRMFVFTLAVAVIVAMMFGLWPALRFGRADASAALREAGDTRSLGNRAGARRRRVLAGLELALSVVLLASSGLLVRSMVNLMSRDTGFDARHVLTFGIALPSAGYSPDRQRVFLDQLLERLRALPGVESVGSTSHLPLGGGDTNGGFAIVGRPTADEDLPHAKKRIVSPGYFETLHVPLLQGRYFDDRDRAGAAEVVIISEAVARRWWPGENPVGRRVRFLWGSDGEQEVVGVVGDVLHDGLDQPVDGMIFRPAAQFVRPAFSIVVRTSGEPLSLVDATRAAVRALDADLPVSDAATMQQVVAASIASRRTIALLFTAFALLAVVLATVGVYAIAAQAVTQRTGEIGLRMAMGARRVDVLRMVLANEMPAIVVGALGGLSIAVAATRVLRASLFGIAASDPMTLTAAATLLSVIALGAILVPARRASRLDPLDALRGP